MNDEFYRVKLGSGGCLLWSGGKNRQGYGKIWWRGKDGRAHRAAWEKANGPIPKGLFVLHRCDNPSCINPAHLFLGTHAQNMADKVTKGRQRPGALHGMAVISEQTAIRIKMLRGVLSSYKLSRHLPISRRTILDIQLGKRWKHLTATTRYGP